jgi:hypothetical protein
MPQIEGWSDEDLLRNAAENLASGSDAGLPDQLRFLSGVIRLLRRRIARGEPLSAAPAAFFLLPSGPTGMRDDEYEVVPMLDNGLTTVEGAYWFVGPVVARALTKRVEDWDDADVFAEVGGNIGLASVPTVIFETRTDPPGARYYPTGLGTPDRYEEVVLNRSGLRLDGIFDVIDRVYASVLVTPAKSTGIWADAGKHWVSSSAEDNVQLHLRLGLVGALPGFVVRAEQSQATGRLDLEVEEQDSRDPSVITRHAILELKILRTFGHAGNEYSAASITKAVRDGVTQAFAYREERGARSSALCCFDMRVKFGGDECFSGVVRKARDLHVELRSWHLFASAGAYREHLAAQRLATE